MVRNLVLCLLRGHVFDRLNYSSTADNKLHTFQAILDQWPADTCGRKMTFSSVIAKRLQQAVICPSSQALLDQAEYDSLLRILSNHHRDKYKLPTGLGRGALDSNAPQIAATGADLLECRRILFNQEEYLKRIPKRSRFWTVFKRLLRFDSLRPKSTL
ncbi:hypothetical protein FBUS_06469 [Fasciolopsis buskii]|uniref:Ubiquinol-cytochrome-c reductase complex assembly factor 2 n=1 Tax=Fasciolopsis buskii TaxID=27845 RepID=A0A8E0RY56_9TREM|nr:hypothetical protein FBUS_06469 [Fasciolopsis buski]